MTKLSEKLKQMKFKDFVYPTVTMLGLVVFIIIFGLTINFLFNSINLVFISGEEEWVAVRFNVDGFNRIADRLGIE